MRPPRSSAKQRRNSEVEEIELLDKWIESGKPDSGSNPLSIPPPSHNAPVGRIPGGGFSPYAGCELFRQLPLSQKTLRGLKHKFADMTEIQRASLPHSLCGRDILGAAKTGSGKTLAFIIPVVEKLYRARWGPEDGVGSIIISPTAELAGQLFDVLKTVGRYHSLSAGLLIGGRKDVEAEKERVNGLNILVCTPGRLLQHMDETANFECSQLQILVLDEADRILDEGFRREVDAIVSQLPIQRQTLLFSATQTKSVKDLARLSLKDPEYISVHIESVTATPERLKQLAMVVPLDQKLNMLWSFIKAHLRSKILVFLTTCKQVKFVYEVFKKLRPGTPLKCLHGRMKQGVRTAIYSEFCETTSVLFSTDVTSRGLDFPSVDWVVQVDCPEDVPTYIHRVGRTARFTSDGKSILFISPSEEEMITKLQGSKIPIQVKKANMERLQPISGLVSSVLAKYPEMQSLAKRAFETYLKSVKKQRDKEVFDVFKLPIEEYAVSMGLPMIPKIRFINHRVKGERASSEVRKMKLDEDDDILLEKGTYVEAEEATGAFTVKANKKKKLKISLEGSLGTRMKFDEDGNLIPPLAAMADTKSSDDTLRPDKVKGRYESLFEEMKQRDKKDKILQRERIREEKANQRAKMKRKRGEVVAASEDSRSDLDEEFGNVVAKRYHASDDGERGLNSGANSTTLAEQEALALKLLSSMHT